MIREFHHIDLQPRNSFGVAQRARHLIEFETKGQLASIFEGEAPQDWYVLAGGNNILFTRDYQGTLLTPTGRIIEQISDQDGRVVVRAQAGVEWDDLVEWAVERDLWGLENLSLIPGKVGAAPIQNIGAYGCEAADTIQRVEMFCTQSRTMLTMPTELCQFGYRESIFKGELRGKVIITAVEFNLSRTPNPRLGYGDLEREVERLGGANLRNIREAICTIRRSKLPDPKELGNAGSFFKNPVVEGDFALALQAQYPEMPLYPTSDGHAKLAAGWLIDKAGLKGFKQGNVGVHHRQGLVLVNLGGATGGQVIDFARMIQARIESQFGVKIDTEVNIL